jgi:hypothetical protein
MVLNFILPILRRFRVMNSFSFLAIPVASLARCFSCQLLLLTDRNRVVQAIAFVCGAFSIQRG